MWPRSCSSLRRNTLRKLSSALSCARFAEPAAGHAQALGNLRKRLLIFVTQPQGGLMNLVQFIQ